MSVNNSMLENKELLNTFWGLAEGDDNGRIKSSRLLLQILEEKQGKNDSLCPELDYSLNRLLQGLSSTRKWARLGFATALTQVLRVFPFLDLNILLERISEKLKISGTETKSEYSNIYVGQIMAYLALIQANKVQKSDSDDIKMLVQAILTVRGNKLPLHHLCTQALVQLITKVSSHEFSEVIFPLLQNDLTCGWQKCTPDTLHLLFTAVQHQSETIDKKFLQQNWGAKHLICEKNFESVAYVLMQSTYDHPIVHPVCVEVMRKAAKNPQLFTSFWKNVLIDKVFGGGPNRKHVVINLVPESLKLASTETEVYTILSPWLVHNVMKHLSSKDQLLYPAVKQMVTTVINSFAHLTSGEVQVAMVTALVTSPGTVLFDGIVKTKVVGALLTNLTAEGTQRLSEILTKNVLGEEITRPYSEEDLAHKKSVDLVTQQKWSVNTLSLLFNQAMITNHLPWCYSILEFLFRMAYFDPVTKDKSWRPIDQSVKQSLSSSFFRVLDKVSKYFGKGIKGFLAYTDLLHHMVVYTQTLLEKDDVKPSRNPDPEVLEAWQKMYKTVEKIKRKREKSTSGESADLAFELMFLHHGLQLLHEQKSALEVLQELHTCYDKANQKKRRQSVVKKAADDGETEPHWVDVVVDLLMSLLSQPSHHVRTVVSTVFTMLCPHLTRDSLQLIIDDLKPLGASAENPIEFVEEEDMDFDNEEEEQKDESEDVSEDSSSSSESSEEEEDEEEEEGEEDKEVNQKLRNSLKNALGKAADVDSGTESSDDDFDDETMIRLDPKLAAVFRIMRKAKKKDPKEELQLIHYKMRCLDLVDILINSTTSASLHLDLVYPLLRLIEWGIREKSHKVLGERATKVFHHLTHVKKITQDQNLKERELVDMFKSLVDFSTKIEMIPLVKELGRAGIFVIHIMLGENQLSGPSPVKTRAMAAARRDKQKEKETEESSNIDTILAMVEDKLTEFFMKRDSPVNPIFFQTMLELDPGIFWPITDLLHRNIADNSVRIFCRTRACLMLSGLMSKSMINELDSEVWSEFAAKTITMIHKVLANKTKDTQRPRFLQELLCLLHKIIAILDKELTTKLVSSDLIELLKQVKSSGNQDSRQAINRICGLYLSRNTVPGGGGKKNKKRKRRKSQGENPTDVMDSPKKSGDPSPGPGSTDRIPSGEDDVDQKNVDSKTESKTNGHVTDNQTSTSKSKKKKKKSKTLKSEEDKATQEGDDGEHIDNVRKNLDNLLLEAKSKTPKKRRKSEAPMVSNDITPSVKNKSKKKRKSLGDVS